MTREIFMQGEQIMDGGESGFSQSLILEAIRKDLGFDPEKISKSIARSLCEPTDSLYKRTPALKNDPFKAMGEVTLNGMNEKEITDPVAGLLVGAAKLETAKKELNLSTKQKEAFDGVRENIYGAIAWAGQNKMVRKALIGAEAVGLTLSSAGCVNSLATPEHTPQTPAPVVEVMTATPTETPPIEIPENQIKLNENSFIPTGEYPKNGDNLILLGDENVGESAKDVVIENGLGEQAKAIEEMYQSILDKHRLHSGRIPEVATISFTYLVYSKDGVGSWTVAPILNGFGIPRVIYPVLYDSTMPKNQPVTQGEFLNIAISSTYPKNMWPVDVAMPVGFGKDRKISYFTDQNGNFVVGIPDKNSNKPLMWYNTEREIWQTVVSENGTNENTNLQENIDLWMNGNVTVSDDEKFKSGDDITPLGLVESSDELSTYQGIVLGTEQYGGNLIAYFGFEDDSHKHFFMPISLGSVDSNTASLGLTRQVQRQLGVGSNHDVGSAFSVNAGGEVFNRIEMKVVNLCAVEELLQWVCQNETNGELKNLCNEQMAVAISLPELFSTIANYGSDGVENPLVNGTVGKNGLGLSGIPLINQFRILTRNEPSSNDY